MKKKLQVMLMALAAAGAQGYAADLKKPALKDFVQFKEFTPEDTVYIYNVGLQMLYGKGEAWGTQATLTEEGLAAFLREDTASPGNYRIWTEGDKWSFRTTTDGKIGSGVKALFTDGDWNRGNNWVVKETKAGSNLYTISVPEGDGNYEKGKVLGGDKYHRSDWVGSADDARENKEFTYGVYFDIDYDSIPENGTWGFVPANVIRAYNLKDNLAEKINEAEARGVDVVAAVEVHNSTKATLEDTQKAIDDLTNAIADNVTPDKPMDMSDVIVNRVCDGATGWTTDAAKALQKLDYFNDDNYIKSGGVGFWEDEAVVGNIYQKQKVRPGVYKFSLSVALATLHENDSNDPVQFVYTKTSNGIAQKAAITAIRDRYEVFAFVGEDGDLEFGFDATEPVCNQFLIDNAELTYYGNSLDAYIYASQEVGKKGDLVEEEEDGLPNYTPSYKDALEKAVKDAEATETLADAATAFGKVVKAYNDFENSVQLYERVKTAYDEAEYYYLQMGLDMTEFLDQLDEILSEATGTNEEISKLLDDIEAEEIVYIKQNITPNSEYPFLANNTFKYASTEGWTPSGAMPGVAKGGTNGIIDIYNAPKWGLQQVLEGCRAGVWRFEVKCWYRVGQLDNAITQFRNTNGKHDTPDSEIHTKFSINGKVATVVPLIAGGIPDDLYQELSTNGTLDSLKVGRASEWSWDSKEVPNLETGLDETRWYPGMGGSAGAMYEIPGHEDDYTADVKWIVGKDGKIDLRIFDDNETHADGSNTILKEVHLYYVGNDVATMKEVLGELIQQADDMLKNQFEASERTKLEAAKKAAETVKEKADDAAGLADEITKAYADLVDALEVTTVDEYNQLAAELETSKLMREQYKNTATDEALAAADALIASVEDGLKNGTYSAESALAEIPNLKTAAFNLKKPKGEASDDAPQDWTFMITNPKYLEGSTGWTIGNGGKTEVHSESNTGVAEIWNNDGTISQVVKNLPVGTYKVSVQGFYRQGDFTKHANTFKHELAEKYELTAIADSLATLDLDSIADAGVLYGNESGVVPMTIIYEPTGDDISIFQSATGDAGNWQTVKQDVLDQTEYGATWYFPSGLTAAADRFSKGLYDNYFYATVVDESDDNPADGFGNLELGLRTYWHHNGDWIPFTNWRLEFYGANSKYAEEVNNYGATNSVDRVKSNAEVISTEYFSVDGTKQSSLRSGLNIVRTKTADGKIITKKVLKK